MFKEIKNINFATIQFLNKLKKPTNEFSFFPVLSGNINSGSKLNLGFSTYGLKILHILKEWDNLDDINKNNWINYLYSFQFKLNEYPKNYFLDLNYLYEFNKFSLKSISKESAKIILNKTLSSNYKIKKIILNQNILAETKQTISTLHTVGANEYCKITDFPSSKQKINEFLDSLNWETPWSAGAQFSNLALLISTQLTNEINKVELQSYLNEFLVSELLDSQSGAYFKNQPNSIRETINGAMKIITSLDWLNIKIHEPEKLIDYCIKNDPISEGCDVLDTVYVLYKCFKASNYKEKEIKKYFDKLYNKILEHFHQDIGGFSYFTHSSQDYYYGVKISKKLDEPDIHGTLLFLWGYTMMYDMFEVGQEKFNILVP